MRIARLALSARGTQARPPTVVAARAPSHDAASQSRPSRRAARHAAPQLKSISVRRSSAATESSCGPRRGVGGARVGESRRSRRGGAGGDGGRADPAAGRGAPRARTRRASRDRRARRRRVLADPSDASIAASAAAAAAAASAASIAASAIASSSPSSPVGPRGGDRRARRATWQPTPRGGARRRRAAAAVRVGRRAQPQTGSDRLAPSPTRRRGTSRRRRARCSSEARGRRAHATSARGASMLICGASRGGSTSPSVGRAPLLPSPSALPFAAACCGMLSRGGRRAGGEPTKAPQLEGALRERARLVLRQPPQRQLLQCASLRRLAEQARRRGGGR